MLDFVPLHELFGAEVCGVDLRRPLDGATFAAIRDAFERRSLLVFRDQPVDDAQQIAFSRRFGPLEATKVGTVGAGSELVILTNVGADGAIVPPSHQQALNDRANQLWHSDSSFKPVPALGSALSAREVPSAGGETEYASMRAVYRALSPAMKERIEGLVAVHSYAYSRSKIDPNLATAPERAQLPPVEQPVVQLVPGSGEKALYLGSHASHIVGWPEAEGRALIEELLAFATQPRFVHRHHWRRHDLVLWDNRAVIHRGRPYDQLRERRTMVRTTIAGTPVAAAA